MKKILTYHVHGSYLYYLSQVNCLFYLPVKKPLVAPFLGKTSSFSWRDNVIEVPVEKVKNLELDCIIFQSNYNPAKPNRDYLQEQKEILSQKQLEKVPQIFLEHDPPRKHPTDTKHFVKDLKIAMVHVTPFNKLMWDCSQAFTTVIEHGVVVPDVKYTGKLKKGVVVINNLSKRGRRLGLDVFEKVKSKIPLDLIGIGSEELGGLGDIPPYQLAEFISQYRFFFNPIRYTSLGLSVIEAMMVGMPIISLATTEHGVAIKDGERGYSSTDIDYLIHKMQLLLKNHQLAVRLGQNSQQYAQDRFGIGRFTKDWLSLINNVSQTTVKCNL